jgi:hypothetical protein
MSTSDRVPSGYIAHLWEHPQLVVAVFESQVYTPEGGRLYAESGIVDQIMESLEQAEGHLLTRRFATERGGVLLQYWRSFDDLERYSRTMPHTAWWRWLVKHRGQGIGFHHEIYQARTAEAIYLPGTPPVGPATFCEVEDVFGADGRSAERQRRFADAAG